MKITAYCMDWHLTKSDAFKDMLVDPLKGSLEVKLLSINEWRKNETTPAIFCQVAPPNELLEDPRAKVVWLPMWDNVHGYDQAWWNNLPKHLRVVCFSQAVYERASHAGLPALRITYFKNPADFEEVQWDNRKIFYWNRTGLIGPEFLKQLCRAIGAGELIFMPTLDPGAPAESYYELPSRLGDTAVRQINQTNREVYLKDTGSANIFIAPRTYEGVGMTFLEAMARGSAVMAYDAPTMNEYVHHGQNGYLFNTFPSSRPHKRAIRLTKRLVNRQTPSPYALPLEQNWSKISHLNLEVLGGQARDDHLAGYEQWEKSLDKYAEFLTSW